MKRQRVIIVVALLVAAGVLGFHFWPAPKPPAQPETPTADLVKFRTTESWAKLPPEKRRAYADELYRRNWGEIQGAVEALPREQRNKVVVTIMKDNPVTRAMDEYFTLPEGPGRVALLDQTIDLMERRMPELRRPATQPAGGGGGTASGGGAGARPTPPWGQGDNIAQDLKNFVESMPPDRLFKMMEFRKAMRDRRAARGLPERPTPGPR